ncbi:phosphoribosyl-AMP cyclohydrolase [Pseudomonas fluorescens]|uniref:phosphoribosyl-AMP cyclohydrolase n=1 Tax=Pseudomonas TaxID=286 RepID=UPI000D0DAD3D|nr:MULTISPECIES: phosphoribosyl-AMP cyclohydrolase [Pseudomonas]MBT0624638.1 phosphoribosyl-AMP cyclohydrolase [Pseudomonas fluorescens]PSL96131.1 phosphoribosyl-AMP cyclohydrolase [Pseudomonas sp. R9.37]
MTLSMLDLEEAAMGSRFPLETMLDAVAWNSDGLIAAVAQQHGSGEVLMLAWMNRQALTETLATGQVCYWSRSRGQLWRKGESSGHWQQLVEARLDCDGDAVLLIVDQQGPACHTGRPTCFYNAIDGAYVHVITEPSA